MWELPGSFYVSFTCKYSRPDWNTRIVPVQVKIGDKYHTEWQHQYRQIPSPDTLEFTFIVPLLKALDDHLGPSSEWRGSRAYFCTRIFEVRRIHICYDRLFVGNSVYDADPMLDFEIDGMGVMGDLERYSVLPDHYFSDVSLGYEASWILSLDMIYGSEGEADDEEMPAAITF